MNLYTVVGYYADNFQSFVIRATTKTIRDAYTLDTPRLYVVIAVFEGHPKIAFTS